jgi:hypothetical protein
MKLTHFESKKVVHGYRRRQGHHEISTMSHSKFSPHEIIQQY